MEDGVEQKGRVGREMAAMHLVKNTILHGAQYDAHVMLAVRMSLSLEPIPRPRSVSEPDGFALDNCMATR